jgi:glycosyltransferase involved in cell wall biosynthesis
MTIPQLRIALTADPELPVPPKQYGGIERIIDMLIRGLVERGHDVTLFAHPDSDAACRLVPYSCLASTSRRGTLSNLWLVSSKVRSGEFDIVHSFGRLAYLLRILPLPIPKIMSYQRVISSRSIALGERLSRGTLHFTGCSRQLIERFNGRSNWHVVHNGVPLATYAFRENAGDDAPLVFLGRVEEIKGPHLAIDIAHQSKRRLVIAGNVPGEPKHIAFFEAQIAPYIDGRNIEYIGPVNDEQKNNLLGGAAALLMPILWDEPFGIVMAEALACGTPVIALRRGSVPEVVEDEVTGFVCDSTDEMVEAVGRIAQIDRKACRQVVEERFSDRAVVDGYESLYRKIIEAHSRGNRVQAEWQKSA